MPKRCPLAHSLEQLLRYQADDLPLHMRRHRRRYREHTRPYLRRALCPATQTPLLPGEGAGKAHARRSLWMWAHALELLRALDAHAPRMTAPERSPGGRNRDYEDLDAAAGVFEPRVVLELCPGALATRAPRDAIERAGYRVERAPAHEEAGAPALEAERDFLVCVRERPAGVPFDAAPGLTHAELVASLSEGALLGRLSFVPPEWLEPPRRENETEPE